MKTAAYVCGRQNCDTCNKQQKTYYYSRSLPGRYSAAVTSIIEQYYLVII